jgi:hypothetical protein
MIFRRLETYILYRVASSLTILGFFFFAIIILRLPQCAVQLERLLGAYCCAISDLGNSCKPSQARKPQHVWSRLRSCHGGVCRLEMPTWVLVVISITNDMSAMFTSFDKVGL